MKALVLCCCLFVGVGCSSSANVKPSAVAEAGFVAVSGTSFDTFLIQEPRTLGNYTAVYFEPLKLDGLVVNQRRLKSQDGAWKLSDAEKLKVIAYFDAEVKKVFEKGQGLKLASVKGEGVLSTSFELIEFSPNGSKDGAGRGARDQVFTYSVGDIKFTADLSDSVNGDAVAKIENNDKVGDSVYLQRNNRGNNTRHLKITMRSWVQKLKKAIEDLQ